MKTIEDLRNETELPVMIADHDALITHVNASFEAAFGWTKEEIIGKPISVIIPPHLRDAHGIGFSRFLTTGQATLLNEPIKLPALRKDGREFDAEHFIVAERIEGRWVFGATLRPLGP